MKEFIEKLIGRLEERKGKYFDGLTCEGTMIRINEAINIVNQLAEEYNNANDSMEIQIAKNYAKCLVEYGVDIREKWETATSQSMALEQAYLHGRQDERNRFTELQEEHNNGWIPCSERLPEPGKRYLVSAIWKDEVHNYRKPAVYDAVFGGDGLWHSHNYEPVSYEVIAWQPLPALYHPKGE